MFVTLLFVAAGLAAAAQSPSPRGVVKGRLVLAETGEPAAHVSLRVVNRAGDAAASGETDDEGRFRFDVRPGVYMIRVTLPGDQKRYLGGTLGSEGRIGEGEVFRIRDGAERIVDYGLKCSASLGGTVLTPDDKPLKSVLVSVTADPDDNQGEQIQTDGAAITDGNGRFLVSGLAPGIYRILANPPDAQPADAQQRILLPTYHPDRVRAGEAVGIPLAAGDQFDAAVIRMVRGPRANISGVLYQADGTLAVERAVVLRRGGASSMSLIRGDSPTDAEGRFAFRSVLPGHYEIVPDGQAGEFGHVSIDVGTDDIRDITLQMTAPMNLTGRIVFDEEAHPAGHLSIQGRPPTSVVPVVRADVAGDGSFELSMPGPRFLAVPGVPDGWHVKAVLSDGRNILNTLVDPRLVRSPITIVLSRRTAGLTGVVRGASDTAVVLVIADDEATWNRGSTQVRLAEADEQGGFEVENLPPGGYRLIVTPQIPGGFLLCDHRTLAMLSSAGVPVEIDDGDRRRITLEVSQRLGHAGSTPELAIRYSRF